MVGGGTGVLVGGACVGAVVGVGVAADPQAARISAAIPTRPTTHARVLGLMSHLSLSILSRPGFRNLRDFGSPGLSLLL